MRKILLILAITFGTMLHANAMKELTGEFQPWDSNCQVAGNTITFLGEWNGVTFKFFDDEGCVFEGGTDLSAYDMIVLQMSDASCLFKIKSEYTDGVNQQDSWGAEVAAKPGQLIAGIALNPDHKNMVKDFYLQSTDYPGSLTIEKVLACTTAEYEQLLRDHVAARFNLTLRKINEGGGADYNPDTQTITIHDDWSHRGWYVNDQFRDFSAFDNFIIEFKTPTATGGEIGIEYDDGTTNGATGQFEAGTTRLVVPLSASKNKLRQVYVKGSAGSQYVINMACFATTDYTTGVARVRSIETKGSGKPEYYTLDGKRMDKPSKGIHIEKINGKAQKILIQ